MSALATLIEDLLFNCSWNCTSDTGHVVKVLLAASRGTLEEEIHEDMRKKGDYMKGNFLSKLPILQQTDKTVLFETIVERIRNSYQSPRLNINNLDIFIRHNMLELFREFDTNFRGDVQSISELPTQKPTLIIQTRKFEKGNPEIRWYVAHHDEQGKKKTQTPKRKKKLTFHLPLYKLSYLTPMYNSVVLHP